MKFKFAGLARQVYLHEHKFNNLRWKSGLEASGNIKGLGLSGDFRVNFDFEEQDVIGWAEALVKSNPELALKIANKMQADAIISLTNKLIED